MIAGVAVISLLRSCLLDAQQIIPSEVDDQFVWYPNGQNGSGRFSTSETWEALFPSIMVVSWNKKIWFSGRISKYAFLSWVTARDRMVTRNRIHPWGLQIPTDCVLCSGHSES